MNTATALAVLVLIYFLASVAAVLAAVERHHRRLSQRPHAPYGGEVDADLARVLHDLDVRRAA